MSFPIINYQTTLSTNNNTTQGNKKMKKKHLITLVIFLITICFSQTIDDLIKGPITGFTYAPDAGKFDISADMVFLSSNSIFDDNGDEITYNKLTEGILDPEMSMSAFYLKGEYSLFKNFGLSVSVPIINKQEMEMNPSAGYEEYFTDLSGETGLGDMTIGAWYQLSKNRISSIMAIGGYTLATGSSPEDIGESNFSSTGSGHTSIGVGISVDFMVASNILASASGGYIINQEAAFSSEGYSWDEKEGNEISLHSRISLLVLPQVSFGLDFDYFSGGESEIDGESIDDSNSSFMSITPMIGYQLSTGAMTVNISGGYFLHISGTNYPKLSGMAVGVIIFI